MPSRKKSRRSHKKSHAKKRSIRRSRSTFFSTKPISLRIDSQPRIKDALAIHKRNPDMISPEEIYDMVKTFDDLLEINKAFLRSELAHTYYYFERWGQGDDQNTHSEAGSTLEQLHNYHIYTINGQSDYCEIDRHVPKWPSKDEHGNLIYRGGHEHYSMFQRSFVHFHIPLNMFQKLLPLLMNDGRLFVSYARIHNDKLVQDNNFSVTDLDKNGRLPLTTEQTDPTAEIQTYSSELNKYTKKIFKDICYTGSKKLTGILLKTVFVMVASKEFCKGKADDILLELAISAFQNYH